MFTKKKIDKRKKYFMVLDTETCPIDRESQEVSPNNMLVYDIGYCVVDKKGNVYTSHPATGTEIVGFEIPNFDKAMDTAKECAKEIEEKLLETTNYHEMEMHFSEDSSLIGGMVIRIGDRVVDSSIQTSLLEMRKQLLKVNV